MTAILAMLLHPDVQQKARDELDRVVGKDRLPTSKDMKDLHTSEQFAPKRLGMPLTPNKHSLSLLILSFHFQGGRCRTSS